MDPLLSDQIDSYVESLRAATGKKRKRSTPRPKVDPVEKLRKELDRIGKPSAAKNTSIEIKVQTMLTLLGIPFDTHMRIARFECDVVIPDRWLVIECDGDYWHRSKKVKEKDARKDKFLAQSGYRVLRLTEKEIRKMTPEALQRRMTGA